MAYGSQQLFILDFLAVLAISPNLYELESNTHLSTQKNIYLIFNRMQSSA